MHAFKLFSEGNLIQFWSFVENCYEFKITKQY